MSIRKERPMFADIYPEGKYTCGECGTTNLAGESFHYHIWKGEHCPDCHKFIEDNKKREQIEQYQSGEDEPCGTDEVTCPWCGYEYSDSWEFGESEEEEICQNCEKEFSFERHVEVTYNSSRVEETK